MGQGVVPGGKGDISRMESTDAVTAAGDRLDPVWLRAGGAGEAAALTAPGSSAWEQATDPLPATSHLTVTRRLSFFTTTLLYDNARTPEG